MLKIALVHHAALIQHHDPVRYPGDGVQIVRDKYHGSLFFLLDPQKLVQDLILGDGVNGGGRLVRNQKDGFHSGGDSDHDPLEHSAGELVGILLQYLLRIADTHFFQQLKRAAADLLPVPVVVGGKGLGDLGADTIERVETGHWILQYNAHLAAPQAAQFLPALFEQRLSLKHCRAGHGKAFVQQTHSRLHRHGFSAARLSKDTQTFTRLHCKRDALYELRGVSVLPEGHMQLLQFKNRGHRSTSLGSNTSRRASPIRLKQHTRATMAMPGAII